MSGLLKEKRSTRGQRMSELVGEALEQDSQFYGDSVWTEEESDDSYEDDEVKPDEFDSDFNDTEDEDGPDDDAEESATRKSERNDAQEKNVGRYKEPTKQRNGQRPKGTRVLLSLLFNKKRNVYIYIPSKPQALDLTQQ